jgi:hypothetical protein
MRYSWAIPALAAGLLVSGDSLALAQTQLQAPGAGNMITGAQSNTSGGNTNAPPPGSYIDGGMVARAPSGPSTVNGVAGNVIGGVAGSAVRGVAGSVGHGPAGSAGGHHRR